VTGLYPWPTKKIIRQIEMIVSVSKEPEILWCRYLSAFLLLFVLIFNANVVAAEKSHGSIGTSVVPTTAGHLVVLKVIKGSPAAQKGILPGDLIFEVNNFDLTGSEFAQVVTSHLWGEVGTVVDLKILRPGKEGVISLRLVRVKILEKATDLEGVKMILPEDSSPRK
jgi:predicted metalloprotease with PDZ domain